MYSVDFGRDKEFCLQNYVILPGAYTVHSVHYELEKRKCIFLVLFLLA